MNLMPRRVETRTDEQLAVAEGNRPTTQMLLAISATGKHLYQGTVPAHVKARRRRQNKAARLARRAGR
jgi:hypothetical protein